MSHRPAQLSLTFTRFFQSEKAASLVLLGCTAAAVAIANSAWGPGYLDFWRSNIAGLTLEHWVNDALMAVFFLFVGLELERELYVGELSDLRAALLPVFAAVGGIAVPAGIHLALNAGTVAQAGAGIPMATDIAFALGALALLGSRIPDALKVFLTALAVIDDLGAVLVIAIFYTAQLSFGYLAASLGVLAFLAGLNRFGRVMALWPYLLGGAVMWVLMLKSGVHATVAGVVLAFAIPFSSRSEDGKSPSHRLEHFLHRPVAFIILPAFALANAGIVIGEGWLQEMTSPHALGIMAGLVIGKPVGIVLASLAAVMLGLSVLPPDLRWRHIFGAGLLAGIGFTMSIFIANLAFARHPELVNGSKMAIFAASLIAGLLGLLWLRVASQSRRT